MDVRGLTSDDLDIICRHREEMFRDAGRDEQTLISMTTHFRTWLAPRLHNGSYFGFVICENEQPIAGVGSMLIDWPPHPSHPTQDQRGYVLNVYVEPAYRRRGLARELMRLVDAEFAKRGIQYGVLHTTEKGRPLYTGLGWNGTTEMAKVIAT